ncbi:hypothetical protein [Aliivibrio fischeri]|uniref:hypothetical protein n=1 Tax=Aliivibrio fischeri TaxID=668 RepID=UPI0007C56EC4|nr:hypothetical protein [Aliivibrio fischeri]
MKRKIVLFGFYRDYHRLEIEGIREYYDITTINIPSWFMITFSKLRFLFPGIYHLLFILLLRYKLGNKVKDVDLLITMNHPFYIELIKKSKYTKILIMRDTVTNVIFKYFKYFKVYTFDVDDSIKYDISLYEQYASGFDFVKDSNLSILHDVSFIGLNKGREKIINKIVSCLRLCNLRCNIMLIEGTSRLSYKEYLNQMLSSNIILDIVKKDQTGPTMRLIEALVAKRKVITNNVNIKESELFLFGNIYVVEDVSLIDRASILEFCNKDFNDISDGFLNRYSPTFVLDKIISENLK